MTTQSRLLDLDEFLDLPEEKPEFELVDGEVCQKPVGKKKHSIAQTQMIALLLQHAATRSGRPYVELGMHYWYPGDRRNHRVPDVSYYRAGRDFSGDYPEEPPDLVVEVLSKGQGRESQRRRLAFLRERGVSATLLIDPESETVEATKGGRTWTAGREDDVVLASLDGFSFRVADLLT